jgi:hypothetical protein
VNRAAAPELHLLQTRARQAPIPLHALIPSYFFGRHNRRVCRTPSSRREEVFVVKLFRMEHERAPLNSGEPSNTKRFICAPTSVSEVRPSIARYLAFYSRERPHSSLDDCTPTEPISARKPWWLSHDRRPRFCRSSGRACPPGAAAKSQAWRCAQPRRNPLKFRGACPKKRSPALFKM